VDNGYLELADWRRRVAEMYAAWRHESESDPERATQHLRATRDHLFRSHPQSPLKPEDRARFGGLSYFAYDAAYRMTAIVEPVAHAPVAPAPALGFPIQLPASVTPEFSFRLIGRAHLSGPLTGLALPVFWMAGYAGGIFIPFRDGTSGAETYGAGRYLLDTVKGADTGGSFERNEVLLDFNTAYHPSCAYDPKWNCPLAPPESRLEMAIRAGERLAADVAHD
jgi:uncharacterized protein (DUF1684 family)